jgi:hypothetical protein
MPSGPSGPSPSLAVADASLRDSLALRIAPRMHELALLTQDELPGHRLVKPWPRPAGARQVRMIRQLTRAQRSRRLRVALLGELNGASQTGGSRESTKDDVAGSLASHARRELLFVGNHEMFLHRRSDRYTHDLGSCAGHAMRQGERRGRASPRTLAPTDNCRCGGWCGVHGKRLVGVAAG